ncbi:MAG: AAA family ATPase [Methylococcales bacterium]|nr:AAA family ATPase [Methylococcales bacterium]
MPTADIKTYRERAAATLAERALITPERSQKLDLAIHLLSNLHQPLIICGPEGIGKTTLLQTLRNRQAQWRIQLLQGSPELDFTAIMDGFRHFLFADSGQAKLDLSMLRHFCEKQKAVLVIDDADQLPPGVITELLDFCASLPELGLVAAMTHDGFHVKRSTDKAIDDCHFIELPPLSRKDCADYLQNLSARPGSGISFNAVSDALVADLYQASHGIPGRIVAETPKVSQRHNRRSGSHTGLLLGIALAVSCLTWGWFLYKTRPAAENIAISKQIPPQTIALPAIQPAAPPVAQAQAATTGQAFSEPAVAQPATETAQAGERQPPAAADDNPAIPSPIATLAAKAGQPATAGGVETVKKIAEPEPEKSVADMSSHAWIMAQPPDNYTLQVMVLYDKAAVQRVLKKYADYRDSLKYFTAGAKDREKYVVIYGSFRTLAEARKYKTAMPNEFNRSLEKRFKFVRIESH